MPRRVGTAEFMERFEQHTAIMLLLSMPGGEIVDANPVAVPFCGYPRD